MEFDDRFCIALKHTSSNGESTVEKVLATDFFDWEGYGEAEWDCNLPWRYAALKQYLPRSTTSVRSISLAITDNVTNQQRIVHTQYLEGIQLTFSWEDCKAKPGHFEIILDNPLEVGARVARLAVQDGELCVTSHLLIVGDHVTSLLSDE